MFSSTFEPSYIVCIFKHCVVHENYVEILKSSLLYKEENCSCKGECDKKEGVIGEAFPSTLSHS